MTFKQLELGDVYHYPLRPEARFVKIGPLTTVAEPQLDRPEGGGRQPESRQQRVVLVGHRDDWQRALRWPSWR